MGGSVTVQSQLGEGTTFRVSLRTVTRHRKVNTSRSLSGSVPNDNISAIERPMKVDFSESYNDSYRKDSFVNSSHSNHNRPDKVEKPKLLIANDTIPVLENLMLQFKSYFEVHTADNGYVALQKVKQQENACYFDIILLDINMPISDGFDACEKINAYIDSNNDMNNDPTLLKDFEQKL